MQKRPQTFYIPLERRCFLKSLALISAGFTVPSYLAEAGLAPASSLESAAVSILPPGLYTVLLAGLNNGSGVGLVEIYDLP